MSNSKASLVKCTVNAKIVAHANHLLEGYFLFQWKLRFHTFQICKLGDRGGTWGSAILVWSTSKIRKFHFGAVYELQNRASPSPPVGPPQLTYLKSMESQLSLEKNYPSSCFPSVFTFSWNYKLKSIQNEDNGPWSKFQISQPKFHEFQ